MNTSAFGSQAILTHLAALREQADGVRNAGKRKGDSEPVHDMRVASRRLRNTFDLFPNLVTAKWRKRVRKLTKALGAARDTDVQVEFVREAIAHAPERRFRSGLQRLLLRLQQQREALQAKVIKALDTFEKSGVADDITKALSTNDEAAADPETPESPASQIGVNLASQAHIALLNRVQETLAFDGAVRDPTNVEGLHQLRIAFKHLRYSLETFEPLYVPPDVKSKEAEAAKPDKTQGLAPYIKLAKTFQEILGEIHDCDVWVSFIPDFLKAEQERTVEYFGNARSLKAFEPGLAYLKQDREYHRGIRYAEFIDLWQAHVEAGTWAQILSLTESILFPTLTTTPTKIALIGDIHGNLPALEAVLAHAHEQGAQTTWNVGDFVGYGPNPDEVVKRVQAENAISIIGNYDLKVLQVKQKKDKWKKTKRPVRLLAFEWAYDHLSTASRKYLRGLPHDHRLSLHNKRVLLVHGTPDSIEEPLTPTTPLKRLRELAQKAEADIIIAGHSHQPFAKQVDGVWFINTGSVGRPDDGDPRAGYALLTFTPDSIQVEHHRVAYDTERVAADIRALGLPDSFARIFLHGRSLDDLVIEE